MKTIRTQDAVGHVLCHDITQIIRGETKGRAFCKGHIVRAEDIPVLLRLGKEHLYVLELGEDMLHENDAAPVLPGAMLLLSYLNDIPVVGLPGCVMYHKRTVFDLVLPRLLADDPITAEELSRLGEGVLCLNCDVCTFPNCGFGKGWQDEGRDQGDLHQ